MAQVDASLVKQLRQASGAGIMDCKQALLQSAGDLEAAGNWLRKKGLAEAARRSARVAGEGVIAVAVSADTRTAAMIELNSETDFAARNQQFQDLASTTVQLALGRAATELDQLKQTPFPGKPHSVTEEVASLAATIGENLILRRLALLDSGRSGVAGYYVHNALGPDMGKIGVLVGLDFASPSLPDTVRSRLKVLGRQLAMHIAAARPLVVASGDVDPAMLARERDILTEQARALGKSEAVIEKVTEGRLRKYYQEVALLEQPFMLDDKLYVKQVIANASQELEGAVGIRWFDCFTLGSGGEDVSSPAIGPP